MKNKKNKTTPKWIYFLIASILLVDLGLLLLFLKTSSLKREAVEHYQKLQKKSEDLADLSETEEFEAKNFETETFLSNDSSEKETDHTEETVSLPETETEETSAEDIGSFPNMDTLVDIYLTDAEGDGETWAVSIRRLSDGMQEDYHASQQMQSASVIKVFIMAAVYDRICYPKTEELALHFPEQYEGELRELLVNMITVSDNEAANRLVEGLGDGDFHSGAAVVNEYCQENGYSNTFLGRRFLEENPTGDNYTSAADCCQILWDIYWGDCVGEEASAKMLEILKAQTLKEKIPSGLPDGIESANKTGEMPEGYSLGCIENDIAIIFGEDADYVLCILSNNLGGNNDAARERISRISSWVYPCFAPHLVQNTAASGI